MKEIKIKLKMQGEKTYSDEAMVGERENEKVKKKRRKVKSVGKKERDVCQIRRV